MRITLTDVNVSAAKPTSLIGAVFLNLLLGKSFFYCYVCVGLKSYRTDIIWAFVQKGLPASDLAE